MLEEKKKLQNIKRISYIYSTKYIKKKQSENGIFKRIRTNFGYIHLRMNYILLYTYYHFSLRFFFSLTYKTLLAKIGT